MSRSTGSFPESLVQSRDMDGWINLDKPAGISSARAVSRIKRLLPRGARVGHAGTLDPFATGVLVILIGKATRMCEHFMRQPKQYEAAVKLGATTATLDSTSEEILRPGVQPVSRERIEQVLPEFVGEIRQRPPAYSAVKLGGVRAYRLAREGQSAEPAERIVAVHNIELLNYDWPILLLRIDCGKGTYIRSLARDIGEVLAVGGYVAELRRTRVGEARIEESVQLEALTRENLERVLHAIPA